MAAEAEFSKQKSTLLNFSIVRFVRHHEITEVEVSLGRMNSAADWNYPQWNEFNEEVPRGFTVMTCLPREPGETVLISADIHPYFIIFYCYLSYSCNWTYPLAS